ncbi:MAG: phosphate ABC transporter permease PstA, partial [Candidatus Binatia bacterium]
MKRAFWKSGDPFVWLAGATLALSLLMVGGLVILVLRNGLAFFWPSDVVSVGLNDGTSVLGEMTEREAIPDPDAPAGTTVLYRIQLKRGNRDVFGSDFVWLDESEIARRERPPDAVVLERREWGNFYGTIVAVRHAGETVATGAEEGWRALEARLPESERLHEEIRSIEKGAIGANNYAQERIRLELRGLELEGITHGPEVERLQKEIVALQAAYEKEIEKLAALRRGQSTRLVAVASNGRELEIPLEKIVRARRPNQMTTLDKTRFYGAKLWEFLSGDPRESNTEGGVFPAIFGTVMMVMTMSVMVTPLGVLAAVYLREYAKQGPFVSAVRIAVNNLAGVPS